VIQKKNLWFHFIPFVFILHDFFLGISLERYRIFGTAVTLLRPWYICPFSFLLLLIYVHPWARSFQIRIIRIRSFSSELLVFRISTPHALPSFYILKKWLNLMFHRCPFSVEEDQVIINKAHTIGLILRNIVVNDGGITQTRWQSRIARWIKWLYRRIRRIAKPFPGQSGQTIKNRANR
jgi:hypothetical protein